MKKFYYLSLAVAFLLSIFLLNSMPFACQDTNFLRVANGSGGRFYSEGESVHIWAKPKFHYRGDDCPTDTAVTFVFDRWKGDTQYIQDVPDGYGIRSWHTVLEMPDKRVKLRAVYRMARQWQAQQGEMNDTEYYYYFPPEYKAVIVLLHGSGGDASNWTETTGTLRRFCENAVANGYGIIAVESKNRVKKKWDFRAPPRNQDLPNVKAVIENIDFEYELEETPLFAVGISAGGYFASELTHFDQRLGLPDFSGQGLFISAGVKAIFQGVFEQPNTPTLWLMAENEDIIKPPFWPNADANRDAQEHKEILDTLEVKNDLVWLHASPVHKQRFWRICGLTHADSRGIYNALVDYDLLNEISELKHHPLYPANDTFPPAENYPPPQTGTVWSGFYWEYVFPEFGDNLAMLVWRELSQCYARHIFFNEYDNRVVEFFDQILNDQL